MNPLLDAALDCAVAEMDLRPTRGAMPAPLALLRERVVSAIAGVPFYADLYAAHGDSTRRSCGVRVMVR